MNEQLKSYAQKALAEGLKQLPDDWQEKFKLMYGRGGGAGAATTRTVEEAKALDIEQVISEIPEDRLDWAMLQVRNSLRKLTGESNNS